MHPLSVLLHAALAWVSPSLFVVVDALVRRRGYVGSRRGKLGPADGFALSLGFRNRYQLSRRLQKEGLPNLENLAGWIRVLGWVQDWESSGRAISRSALDSERDPRTCYKTVERLTRLPWSAVRDRRFDWALLVFLTECRPPFRYQMPDADRWLTPSPDLPGPALVRPPLPAPAA